MSQRISELIYRSILGTLTAEEREELNRWIESDKANAEFARNLTDPTYLQSEHRRWKQIDTRRAAADMQRRVDAMRNRSIGRRIAVAASIAALAACSLFLFRPSADLSAPTKEIAKVEVTEITFDEITPGTMKAILSDADGKAVELKKEDAGVISNAIIRQKSDEDDAPLCIDVPRGGEFRVILEDSTEVWLNSQTRLRYPAVFAEGERRVEVSGEAYFKVRKDADRPFYVETSGQVIRVYGTSFNVRAYSDEEMTYTTLEEGSVSLRRADGIGGELMLSPGHQALFDNDEKSVDMKVVKTSVITGWRHGRFVFEQQPLANIMRDLSRWYDFDYEFADDSVKDIVFLGSIPRYAEFRTAIKILEKSGGIQFSISGNKVVVSKK